MNKTAYYEALIRDIRSLTTDVDDAIANYANTAAAIWHSLPDINWAGFYFLKKDTLVLGPFQGKPACVLIEMGKGVCGTAAVRRETLIVDDVLSFPGHISCDADSRSEIVVPVIKNYTLQSLIDIDSPRKKRFDETDKKYLEDIATLLPEL
ncbi:MAG: GAF domain-containing protein [Candidatus Marinimicrobia bacterium]|nr:GAF domain-containing protein [Candidatus Neomarinimicrobiota bacterium]